MEHRKTNKAISILIGILMFIMLPMTASAVELGTSIEIPGPYSYAERLPISYEIWDSKAYGTEYQNYKYRDFTFAHGYTSTETITRMYVPPLLLEFYNSAYKVTVTYDFY